VIADFGLVREKLANMAVGVYTGEALVYRTVGMMDAALSEVNKALDLCPSLTDARVDRARALQRLNRHEEAIPDLQAAEKASPEVANIHFLLSQSYRAVGRKQEAQAEMQLFSKLEESSRDASAERAKRLLQDRDNTAPNNQ